MAGNDLFWYVISMQWITNFDLFLFDLDGLLVNTEELHYQAYREMLARRGFVLPWSLMQYYKAAHMGTGNLSEPLYGEFPELKKIDWDVLYAEKKAILTDALQKGALQLMPGVEPLLNVLNANKIERCVVTHSRAEDVALIKQKLPLLNTIPHWLTREDYELPKPHPAGYQKAMQLFLKPGGKVVGFEDTYRGLASLIKAGVSQPVLICDLGHPQMEQPVSGLVRHFISLDVVDLH